MLGDETRQIRLFIIGFEMLAVLASFHLLELLDLLVVIVGVLLELLNCLLVNVGHVQVVHVEALEFLQIY